MTTDDQRGFSYETAQAIAPTWERRREFVEQAAGPLRAWMVRELAPRPGDTVLELAAGAGDTGFEVAEIIGDSGRLISSDFSPNMVEVARRRGEELGARNIDYRTIDAERIDLDDDSVDGVLCRFGYMLMVDRVAALAETRRVLRPGGRLVLGVWGPPEHNPFFAAIAMALVRGGHMPPPDPEGPGIFSMGSRDRTIGLLEGAGFAHVRVDEVPLHLRFGGIREYVEIVTDTAGAIAMVLRGLSDTDRAEVERQVEDVVGQFAVDDGYEVPGLALAGVAS